MIVLGADAHKRSHTIAAVEAVTGQVLGDKTTAATARGFGMLLLWARSLDRDRVWALEDCRHVSGALERLLIGRGRKCFFVHECRGWWGAGGGDLPWPGGTA